MSLEGLQAEIKKLALQDRARLAKWLVESLDKLSSQEIEALWAEEAERRLDELEQGLVEEIPADKALKDVRKAIS